MIGKRLKNRDKVAHRDAFLQEILQHLLDVAKPQKLWHQFFHEGRIGLLDIVDEILYILSREQICQILSDDLRQMGRYDGWRIYYSITDALRALPLILRNPYGRQMERRLKSRDTRDLLLHKTRIHRHIVVKQDLTLTHLDPFDLDDILIRIQLDVVTQTDDRHDRTKLQCDLSSYHDNTVQKIPALVDIGERYDTISKLQLDRVDLEQRIDVLRPADLICRILLCIGLRLDARRLDRGSDHAPAHDKDNAQDHKDQGIQRRHQP